MDLMKKGIIFTMVSLLVSTFFVVMFSGDTGLPLDARTDSVRFKVDVLDRFSQSWEDFSRDSLRASSHWALNRMSDYIERTGTSFADRATFEQNFKECLVNGTLFGNTRNCSGTSGNKNQETWPYYLDQLEAVSENNMTFETEYKIREVKIYQEAAFRITVVANMTYEIRDIFATLNRNFTVVAQVPAAGIKDPLHARYESVAGVVKKIKETDIKPSGWNKINFTRFAYSDEYRYHNDGPSLLMRYNDAEKFGQSSCCGIELVFSSANDSAIRQPNSAVENASYVDHMYFETWEGGITSGCGEDVYVVAPDPYGVQLDVLHLANFNITSDQYQTNCPAPSN